MEYGLTNVLLHKPPFVSISGEAGFFPQGSFCTFIRFQQCNLMCSYCDTPGARTKEGGIPYSIRDILNECDTEQVLITGGEPLMSPGCIPLIKELLREGHSVQVETNGSLSIPILPQMNGRGGWVVDRKGPSSETTVLSVKPFGEQFYYWNVNSITFKYVISPVTSPFYEQDREFIAKDMVELDELGYRGKFIISPMDAYVWKSSDLLCFPSKFKNRVIISLQLHKILGVE